MSEGSEAVNLIQMVEALREAYRISGGGREQDQGPHAFDP